METIRDPLCDRLISPTPTTLHSEYQGRIYWFCCDLCKQLFDREPQKYVVKKGEKEITVHETSLTKDEQQP